jgi:hypothetical protein
MVEDEEIDEAGDTATALRVIKQQELRTSLRSRTPIKPKLAVIPFAVLLPEIGDLNDLHSHYESLRTELEAISAGHEDERTPQQNALKNMYLQVLEWIEQAKL